MKEISREDLGREGSYLLNVKEVIETNSIPRVNKLIEKNWILLRIVPNQNEPLFILGRIRD